MSTNVRHIKAHLRDEITARPHSAHSIDCAHCHRDALTITNGVLLVKSAHGETHANAITLSALFTMYLSIANRATLIDLKRMIEERIG